MPFPLLIALLIAFGLDAPKAPIAEEVVWVRLVQVGVAIAGTGALATAIGLGTRYRVAVLGSASPGLRKWFSRGVGLMTGCSLASYAWIVHGLEWPGVVRGNWGLNDWYLVDDALIILPFLIMQLLTWTGLFAAEGSLRRLDREAPIRLSRHLVLRFRQSLGLISPVILLYLVRQQMTRWLGTGWESNELAEPLELSLLGGLFLMISPVFVRAAWPTRSLPAGPLRQRLERAAARVNFRYRDILIWDTGSSMVNACVTGVLPGFRYILLTDSLIETLTPQEAAAVFGHEVGHVVHSHLPYLGFFFLGSLGVFSLTASVLAYTTPGLEHLGAILGVSPDYLIESVQGSALLILLGLYFWIVFGRLSRRFERQADVFGAKFVSCQTHTCPPHRDEHETVDDPTPQAPGTLSICPAGVRQFADALAAVAIQNGLDPNGRSWRHGTIASRLDFLGWLERNPAAERSFQSSVFRQRLILGLILATAVVLSVVLNLHI